MKHQLASVFFAVAVVAFVGVWVGTEPRRACAAEVAKDLHDPASISILSFEEGELRYTATNGYGARVQGKAWCHKNRYTGRWERDTFKEGVEEFDRLMKARQ